MPNLIVAGAGPGMGQAIAKRFAREGFSVALIARNPNKLAGLVAELPVQGDAAHLAEAANLSDPSEVARAVAAIRAGQGPADVVVYNGGAWNEGAPLSMAPADFDRDLALCVTGAYALVHATFADMKSNGGGTILLTGGGLALAPQYGTGVLSLVAGKSGLRGLGLALHDALKPDAIHVGMITIAGTVAPGTAFDPDLIAEHYWALYSEPRDAWRAEVIFNGGT